MNYPIKKIESNELIRFFIKKPSFLSKKDEELLLDLIASNKNNEFYNFASKIVSGTTQVKNLYIYLMTKVDQLNIDNKEIKNQVCGRIFELAGQGWLNIYDMELIEFCKNNTTDSKLKKIIAKIKPQKWWKEYTNHFHYEYIIQTQFELEKPVKEYFNLISKLFQKKYIKEDNYDKIIDRIEKEVSVFKNQKLIGRLISIKLQNELGFEIISQKLSFVKNKLISN